jgi:hypothetical protein
MLPTSDARERGEHEKSSKNIILHDNLKPAGDQADGLEEERDSLRLQSMRHEKYCKPSDLRSEKAVNPSEANGTVNH